MHARPDIGRPDMIERCRRALLSARNERPRPGLDDKVLTEWNAMFLSTLAEAALLADNDRWKAAAVANGVFLLDNLRAEDGTWHRSWQEDASPRARHSAIAHDLAHLVDAFTRLYELTANPRWLDEAHDVAKTLVRDHWDDINLGLFTVGAGGETLIARQKDLMDNATPSANSVAAVAFLRLSALTADDDLRSRAEDILRLLSRVMPQAPGAFTHATLGLELVEGISEVVIPGRNLDLENEYRAIWRPHCVFAHGTPFAGPLFEGRQEGFAYVCRDRVCGLPARDAAELREQLLTNHPI